MSREPKPTKSTPKSELRRSEIMAAAITIFQRDGFRGASLDDVAEEVGISKSLIYYHFKNKLELLAGMYSRMGSMFYDEVVPILGDDGLDYQDRLQRSIEVHVKLAIENKALFDIYFRERNEIPEATKAKLYGDGDRQYVDALSVLLEDGAKAGVFTTTNPKIAAFTIAGACNWLTFWYSDKPKGDRAALSAGEIATIIYETVGAGLISR